MTEAEEVTLRFEPLDASLLVRHAKDVIRPRGIQFSVRPSDPIAFSGGASLNEHEWHIVVDEGDVPYSPRAAELGALGLMHGPWGKDEDFRAGLIGCVVGQRAFEPLLAAVLAGRLPKNINVNVASAGVVGDDLRGAIWDSKQDRSPPVVRIEFYTPLIENDAKGQGDSTEAWSSAPAPASTGDIQALGKAVRETLLAGQAQVRTIAIAAAVFVLIALFLRH